MPGWVSSFASSGHISSWRFLYSTIRRRQNTASTWVISVTYSRRATRPRKKTGKIEYSLAKEGGQLRFGFLVVPHNAKNQEGAYKFIDYKIRPEVARANTNFIQYANPIMNLAPFTEKSLWVGPGLYPPQTVTQRLAVQPPLDQNVADKLRDIWVQLER